MIEAPRPSELDAAFLRWRERSLGRWRAVLGCDAEDFLGTLYLRVRRLDSPGFCHRSDRETFAWIERVAGFALLEFRRELAQQLGYAVVGLEVAGEVAGNPAGGIEPLAIDRDDAEAILRGVELPIRWRVALMGRLMGLDDATIAAMLGVEMGGVRLYVHQGVKRAKERLGRAA